MTKQPVICAWSGGKDSALMLQALSASDKYRPALLLTTFTEPHGRVSMHDVPGELIHAQADALGLKLHAVTIPWPCPNAVYEARMREACTALKAQNLQLFAFGDLFLEDIRAYREERMKEAGMQAVYPLWGMDTRALAKRFIDEGWKARLCCVDTRRLSAEFAGKSYDRQLLAALPEGVDPCGENGEFHSFVEDGPLFGCPVPCNTRQVVIRDGFAYAELERIS